MKLQSKILSTFVLLGAVGMTASAAVTTTGTGDAAASPAGATEWRHAPGWHHGGAHGGILHQLNLTADQLTKIKAIFAAERSQMQSLRSTQRSTQDRLASTLPTDSGYAALLASAQSTAQSEETLRVQTWGLVLQELTSTQLAQIPGIISAREQAWAAKKAAWQAKHPVPAAP